MQTKLRSLGWFVVASLLWISPTFAVSQRAEAQKLQLKVPTVEIKGKTYPVHYVGTASWYGEQHQGRKMANGQRFDRRKLTAASWYFPLGTTLRVVNLKNEQSVVVTITDRGPNLRLDRILDLSEAAAKRLGYVDQGLTSVFLYPVAPFQTQAAHFDSGLTSPAANQSVAQYDPPALPKPM
jgi:rare lipoprotein A